MTYILLRISSTANTAGLLRVLLRNLRLSIWSHIGAYFLGRGTPVARLQDLIDQTSRKSSKVIGLVELSPNLRLLRYGVKVTSPSRWFISSSFWRLMIM